MRSWIVSTLLIGLVIFSCLNDDVDAQKRRRKSRRKKVSSAQAEPTTPKAPVLNTLICNMDKLSACTAAGANDAYCQETTCCTAKDRCVGECLKAGEGGPDCYKECCLQQKEPQNVASLVCDDTCKSSCLAQPGADVNACRDQCCCKGACLESCIESKAPEVCRTECAPECLPPAPATSAPATSAPVEPAPEVPAPAPAEPSAAAKP
ncbi:unnamed protein product [Cyprideis torosa]|uniref:Uncharacterized protein n=1 Tax=Cyprideis torosa TaxID=163714 RepID=A0A7R8ZQU1_9CRUS|nr:unnamed protein product [Cyprideis torosa]CAG0892775.1 unnamed protein product [Cyprideis torosa]